MNAPVYTGWDLLAAMLGAFVLAMLVGSVVAYLEARRVDPDHQPTIGGAISDVSKAFRALADELKGFGK